MTYTASSVIGMGIYVVEDRIVNQLRLQCCRMVITIYQGLMKLFPPTWQHHHLMIASTIVPIIQQDMSLILGVQQNGKAPRLDASLLRCTLRSRTPPSFEPSQQSLRFLLRQTASSDGFSRTTMGATRRRPENGVSHAAGTQEDMW